MFAIHLNNLQFYAHHGIHEEETLLGNTFELNATVSFEQTENVLALEQTINYVDVYEVIRQYMGTPEPLLETLLQQMAEAIYELDKRIRTISLSIKKLHPPLNNFSGNLGVSYTKDFHQ